MGWERGSTSPSQGSRAWSTQLCHPHFHFPFAMTWVQPPRGACVQQGRSSVRREGTGSRAGGSEPEEAHSPGPSHPAAHTGGGGASAEKAGSPQTRDFPEAGASEQKGRARAGDNYQQRNSLSRGRHHGALAQVLLPTLSPLWPLPTGWALRGLSSALSSPPPAWLLLPLGSFPQLPLHRGSVPCPGDAPLLP